MNSDLKDNQAYHTSGPIAWMASNSVAANLLMLIFLVGGFILCTQVKQEVFPEFTTDIIRVGPATRFHAAIQKQASNQHSERG